MTDRYVPPALPSVNLFAAFSSTPQKLDDMYMSEDPPQQPIFSEDLVNRLKQRQASLVRVTSNKAVVPTAAAATPSSIEPTPNTLTSNPTFPAIKSDEIDLIVDGDDDDNVPSPLNESTPPADIRRNDSGYESESEDNTDEEDGEDDDDLSSSSDEEEEEDENAMTGDFFSFTTKKKSVEGEWDPAEMRKTPSNLPAHVAEKVIRFGEPSPLERTCYSPSTAVAAVKVAKLVKNHHHDRSKSKKNAAANNNKHSYKWFIRLVPLWATGRFSIFGGYSENALLALHQEICDFIDYVTPTQAEITMRRLAETRIARIADSLWPGSETCVYGSLTTGLLLPMSDVDMSILNVSVGTEEALLSLAKRVAAERLCTGSYPQVILKTKVPLVKFQFNAAPIDIDISINAADGKRNSEIIRELLHSYPEARSIVIIVKFLLAQRGFNEPFKGGMGSFCASLLVIAFFQHHPIYTTQCHKRHQYGLGRLLLDFLRFYSNGFNFRNVGISLTDEGKFFLRPQQSSMGMSTQVLVEDPGMRSNNAASSLRHFQSIATVFEGAFQALASGYCDGAKWAQRHVVNGNGKTTAPQSQWTSPPSEIKEAEYDINTVNPNSTKLFNRPTALSRIIQLDEDFVQKREAMRASHEQFIAGDLNVGGIASPLDDDASIVSRMAFVKKVQMHHDNLDRKLLDVKQGQRYDGKKSTHRPMEAFVPKGILAHKDATAGSGEKATPLSQATTTQSASPATARTKSTSVAPSTQQQQGSQGTPTTAAAATASRSQSQTENKKKSTQQTQKEGERGVLSEPSILSEPSPVLAEPTPVLAEPKPVLAEPEAVLAEPNALPEPKPTATVTKPTTTTATKDTNKVVPPPPLFVLKASSSSSPSQSTKNIPPPKPMAVTSVGGRAVGEKGRRGEEAEDVQRQQEVVEEPPMKQSKVEVKSRKAASPITVDDDGGSSDSSDQYVKSFGGPSPLKKLNSSGSGSGGAAGFRSFKAAAPPPPPPVVLEQQRKSGGGGGANTSSASAQQKTGSGFKKLKR